MQFMSTRNTSCSTDFESALMHGLAPDGGLYIPSTFPPLPAEYLARAEQESLLQLGENIIADFLPEIPKETLKQIMQKTLTFPIPLVFLEDNIYLLEVFHGPTLAFKDVGARFMAQVMSYYLKQEHKKLIILVATSGDTGSAIANGFYNMPNIDVFILYPSEKITFLQEKQMTTLGGNIHAIEVEGTFDDCQRLVKTGLLDADLRKDRLVTTANSINIARLLPQIIYHSWGVVQLKNQNVENAPTLVVPSGNFGNLTAAVYAKRIGFAIHDFIAATNTNAIVPHYLHSGVFSPASSQQSLSNAMDVGNPSNFERLSALYAGNYLKMRQEILGISISDAETIRTIQSVYEKTGYILDPHTAVGVAAAKMAAPNNNTPMIVTATAHPAKFPDVIRTAINIDVELPESLKKMLDQPKQAIKMTPDYEKLKSILL